VVSLPHSISYKAKTVSKLSLHVKGELLTINERMNGANDWFYASQEPGSYTHPVKHGGMVKIRRVCY